MNPLHKRVFEISRKYNLSHIGSNITAVDIIDEIYSIKRSNDIFCLSSGHAGLALYVCLERHEGKNAEELYLKYKTHPHRDIDNGIHISSGSLGCGVTLSLGLAMADRNRDVYCLISDGEAAEGSNYETLNVKHKFRVKNLKIWMNVNGYSCLESVDTNRLTNILVALDPEIRIRYTNYNKYPFLQGVAAHYRNLTEDDWEFIKNA